MTPCLIVFIVAGLLPTLALADPLPLPKPPGPGGSCPHGYTSNGSLSLSETYALKYWWCSPPRTGIASVRPTVWTARGIGASLCSESAYEPRCNIFGKY
jgi:hypothetical protein